MLKLSNINENVLTDIIDRSRTGSLRKEDDLSNISKIKPVDMGCSVLWADIDYEKEDEYFFDFKDASNMKFKDGWRLPTLKDTNELREHIEVSNAAEYHVIESKSNHEILKFYKKGIYLHTYGRVVDKNTFYYGWTSDMISQENQCNTFTFDYDNMYCTHLGTSSLIGLTCQDVDDKLCIRLVKDK